MIKDYHKNKYYICCGDIECNEFSYLQYLIINYHKIENSLQLIENEINKNNKNINYKNKLGWTPLMLACVNNKSYHNIVENKDNIIKLANGELMIIDNIEIKILPINYYPSYYIDLIKLLLKYGADINLQNEDGDTVMILICKFIENETSIDVLKLLIENGANINLKNNNECSALMEVIVNFNKLYSLDILKLFIDQPDIDINTLDHRGNTILMRGIEDFPIDIIELLINKGVNINHQNKDGNNLLMVAVKFDFKEIFYLLIKKGVDITLKNKNNKNALIIELNKYDYDINIIETLIDLTDEFTEYYDINLTKNNEKIFDLILKKIDLNNKDILKRTYSKVKYNKGLEQKLSNLILNNNKFSKLDIMFIFSDLTKGEYKNLIKLNNKNMKKRVVKK